MRDETQSRLNRLAVLIDAENISADLLEPFLNEVAKYGTAHVKRIYGDWTNPQLLKWKSKLIDFAIQPIQQFSYTSGKNATDSALIIDAMDLLYSQNFDGFCIVSSDSDFTRLATRIREFGLLVYGFGERKTPQGFISACDKFVYIDILGRLEDGTSVYKLKGDFEKIGNTANARDKITSINTSAIERQADEEQKIKIDTKLIKLLKKAYEDIAEEDEWLHLGPFGTQITKLSPSFDPRNYGYKKLSSLVQATGVFEIKKTPKTITIRLKA
ncbi:NYN domain-containing protein [Kovacikia minuta CCNUW1]|uniref:NYN domain-containing protein n=1 Tax=Kovacikia minuta TaxID=2931930 RepID=UPI001CCE8161|nr:NYN domain-containing protein [Kovacikia minuta]UBF24603.1 NYN domain-containing protein [Kovacikia minuta CCNUW1]